jgi:hypothetical protein
MPSLGKFGATDASVASVAKLTDAVTSVRRSTASHVSLSFKRQRSNSPALDASDASRARVCRTDRRGLQRFAPRSNATDASIDRATDVAQRPSLPRLIARLTPHLTDADASVRRVTTPASVAAKAARLLSAKPTDADVSVCSRERPRVRRLSSVARLLGLGRQTLGSRLSPPTLASVAYTSSETPPLLAPLVPPFHI